MTSIISLVSGGVDSLVMSKIIEDQGSTLFPVFLDYGQIAAEKEWDACREVFKECGLPEVFRANLSEYGKLFPSGLTDISKDIYSDAFLPGRNMLLLLIGCVYGYRKKGDAVAIGLLSEEEHLFPDQTEEFIVNANFALNSALFKEEDKKLMIVTPLINFNKIQVIKLAEEYNIPIEKTYSCHSGKDAYCGKCIACKEILNSDKKDLFPQFGGTV
jgi:7-cyano-7-deazaguanine synthase